MAPSTMIARLALLSAALSRVGAWNCCDSADGSGGMCCSAVTAPAGKGVIFTTECADGGPWCDAGGYECCQYCANDCSEYDAMGEECVLCPGVVTNNTPLPSTCCTTDTDCEAKTNAAQQEYLNTYDKSVVCVPDCVGLHCNMFGICQDCRGCYNTCEGAAYYIDTHPGTPGSEITFCPDSGLTDYDVDCFAAPTPSPTTADETVAPTAAPTGADECYCAAQISDAGKEWFCTEDFSIYCDASCAEGGLWCDAWGYQGCRFCAFSCEGRAEDECVLCPPDAEHFDSYCPPVTTSAPTTAPTPTPTVPDESTYAPTAAPVYYPTPSPTTFDVTTGSPTSAPTTAPVYYPHYTPAPTLAPTPALSVVTGAPTAAPTYTMATPSPTTPDEIVTPAPVPTFAPTVSEYTGAPTAAPTTGDEYTYAPTAAPTAAPTTADVTFAPTSATYAPTQAPVYPTTGGPTSAPADF